MEMQAKEEHAGRQTKCPNCGNRIDIPSPQERIEPENLSRRRPPRPTNADITERPGTRWDDEEDDERPRRRRRPSGMSGKAVTSFVLALLSLPLLCLTGIPALIFGLMGMREIDDSRGRLTGRGMALTGVILGAVTTLAGIILIPLLIGYPAYTRIKEASTKIRAGNNLKQIALALHNYHDTNMRFPPAVIRDRNGKALYSWRVAILPYLEQQSLYHQFKLDEPWDSPHNRALLPSMPMMFDEPLAPSPDHTTTFYQVVVGPGTAYDDEKGPRITTYVDGTPNVILVVEAADPVPWTKPADLTFTPNGPLPRLGGHYSRGFNAAMADGSVRFLHLGDDNLLRDLLQRNTGRVKNLDGN
jgi:prepilin-type processing-associated H-X9-DG protein